jgi:hypothetical protein
LAETRQADRWLVVILWSFIACQLSQQFSPQKLPSLEGEEGERAQCNVVGMLRLAGDAALGAEMCSMKDTALDCILGLSWEMTPHP